MKFLYDHFEHLCKNASYEDIEECIKYIDVSNKHFDNDFINIMSTRHDERMFELFMKNGFDIHYNNDILLGVALERRDYKLVNYLINEQHFDPEKINGCNSYSIYKNYIELHEEFENNLVFDKPIDELITYVKKNKIDVNRNNADCVKTLMGRDDVKNNYKLFAQFYSETHVNYDLSILSRASECGYFKIVKYLVEKRFYNPHELKGCTSYTNHKEIHDYYLSLVNCRVCNDVCTSNYRCNCCHEPLCYYCYDNYRAYCKHGCKSHGPIDCGCSDDEN
jgi:hypothetical protein